MAKTQIINKQINSRNTADYVICPYQKRLKKRAVLACKGACSRFAGIEAGYVVCGGVGNNQTHTFTDAMRRPSLYEVFGDEERSWIVGAYGKPKSLKL
jgi:hypothetical protein